MTTFRDMEKRIKKDGWKLDHVEGAHYHYTHPVKPGKVTIPKHTKPIDFPKWLISSIEEQAGLK